MVEYFCEKHPETQLQNMLKGGAGFCSRCHLYVQADGIPMPTLPPRPPVEAKPKRKRAAKTTAKKTRQRKASATAKV